MARPSPRHPGKKTSQLWYTPEDYRTVQLAAKLVQRPMTVFAILAAVEEAKRVINRLGKGGDDVDGQQQ